MRKVKQWFYAGTVMLAAVTAALIHIPVKAADVAINKTNFPDRAFRTYISDTFDKDKNGSLSASEIQKATVFNPSDASSIASIQGIEFFSSLQQFIINESNLESMDFSKNPTLQYLSVHGSPKLTTLNVSNTDVYDLECAGNALTSLNISNCSSLRYLYCSGNKLKKLNVSKATALYALDCSENQLTALDVSKNTSLYYLECSKNKLTEMNVNNNADLQTLVFADNQLTYIDLSKNTNLQALVCPNNQLTRLNVSKLTKLYYLDCSENQISKLDLEKQENMYCLICNDNKLTALDVSRFVGLEVLLCGNNQLTKLDVRNNPYLTHLSCSGNRISSLDISKNTELKVLGCADNKIEKLNISKNPLLINVYKNGSEVKKVTEDADYYPDLKNFNSKTMFGRSIVVGQYGYNDYRYLICDKSVKITATETKNPMNFKLSSDYYYSKLEWNTVENASRYTVYRMSEEGGWVSITNTTGNTYTDYNPFIGDPNIYTVVAVAADGTMLTGFGDGQSITFTYDPMYVNLTNQANGVLVEWSELYAPNEPAKYVVYRKIAGGDWEEMGRTSSLHFTDKTVDYSQTYYYRVRAITKKGKFMTKAGSGEKIQYLVSAPKISLSNLEDGVEVSWASMNDAVRYNVYIKDSSGNWIRMAKVGGNSYVDSTYATVAGKTYTYSVVGLDAEGHVMNKYGDGKSIVRKKSFVTVEASSETYGVVLQWRAYSGASKYRIYKMDASGAWVKVATNAGGNRKYIDGSATRSANNTYTVVAINSAGNAITEQGRGTTIKFVVPPTIVEATNKSSGVRLTWGSVIDAERYQIYRKTKSTSWEKIASTSGESYIDKSVKSGTTYYYAVVATDKNGKAINSKGDGISIKFTAPKVEGAAELDEELLGIGIEEGPIGEGIVQEEVIEEEEEDVIEEGSEEEISEEDSEEEISEEDSEEEISEEDSEEEISEEDSEEGSEEDIIEEGSEEGSEEDAIIEEGSEEGSEDVEMTEENSEAESEENSEETISEELPSEESTITE